MTDSQQKDVEYGYAFIRKVINPETYSIEYVIILFVNISVCDFTGQPIENSQKIIDQQLEAIREEIQSIIPLETIEVFKAYRHKEKNHISVLANLDN